MKKILIVDDDVRLLGTMRGLLESDGRYDVVTEDSGRRALAALDTIMPDLIILDMNMPVMGGVEFLTNISTPEGTLRYPVLVLTSRANMEAYFDDVAVDGFMAKPCDPIALRKEIDRIILLTPSAKAAPLPARTAGSGRQYVFVGEDDERVSGMLVVALKNAGYAVACFPDGPELLQQAILRQPDIILVKRILVHLNGDVVARMLAELPNTKDIPVVLYDQNERVDDSAATKTGIRKYVSSSETGRLLAAVKDVLADQA